eukprot:2856037-Rhodomonas_salina.1
MHSDRAALRSVAMPCARTAADKLPLGHSLQRGQCCLSSLLLMCVCVCVERGRAACGSGACARRQDARGAQLPRRPDPHRAHPRSVPRPKQVGSLACEHFAANWRLGVCSAKLIEIRDGWCCNSGLTTELEITFDLSGIG